MPPIAKECPFNSGCRDVAVFRLDPPVGENAIQARICDLTSVIGAVGGLWWRIEAAIKAVRDEVSKDSRDAHVRADAAIAAISLVTEQLAAHKLLVAETYITKAGLREFRDDVMTGVRDVKGSVSTLHERMDRFIEGDKMTRKRQQGLSIETYARLLVCMPKKQSVSAVIDGNS